MNQLYIPNKLKIGFQSREDTFTKKLAYVIYYDLKGVLRKEKSWNSWRNKKIPDVEFDNVPTEGFVLNKKVGGHRSHWNYRDAHVRVYDPRDFEFEISVPNLLFILTQCDCNKGKGIEGKFVYAWEGTELVLLPVSSEEYKKSTDYTVLQVKTVKSKELVPGCGYITKKQENLIYLGKFDYHTHSDRWKVKAGVSKRYIFWNKKDFVDLKDLKSLAGVTSNDPVKDLAELTQLYYKSMHGSPIKELFTKPYTKTNKDGWWDYFIVQNGDTFNTYRYYTYGGKITIEKSYEYKLENNILKAEYKNSLRFSYERGITVEPSDLHLYARLESGSEFHVSPYGVLEK